MASYDPLIANAKARAQGADTLAQSTRGKYLSALMGFDPQKYARSTASSLFSGLSEDYARGQGARMASLNSRGLFRSDLGGAAQSRDFNTRLAQALAGLSMQAGQMEQNRVGMVGNLYGADANRAGGYYDSVLGLNISKLQQEAQERASKRGMWGNIIGGGLSALGSLIPG